MAMHGTQRVKKHYLHSIIIYSFFILIFLWRWIVGVAARGLEIHHSRQQSQSSADFRPRQDLARLERLPFHLSMKDVWAAFLWVQPAGLALLDTWIHHCCWESLSEKWLYATGFRNFTAMHFAPKCHTMNSLQKSHLCGLQLR